jgi:hypothetical protein
LSIHETELKEEECFSLKRGISPTASFASKQATYKAKWVGSSSRGFFEIGTNTSQRSSNSGRESKETHTNQNQREL